MSKHLRMIGALVVMVVATSTVWAADAKGIGPSPDTLKKVREQGANFLRSTQAADGSWTVPNSPGICGLVTAGLLDAGLSPDDPTVAKALKHILSFVQPDGGIYDVKSKHRNYESCIAVLALEKANTDGRYDKVLDGTMKFLRKLQWDEGEGLKESDANYGGAGYGGHERPDLSNTQFFLDALQASGASADDPAVKKALIFVSRSQNLESEHNTLPFATKVNDGGFIYTPAAGGVSEVREKLPNGGLRSYGSMTYAGLKSFIYAGLTSDDPRVKAAFKWIQKFYTVDENPGLGQEGLYYYLHTFAKALDTMKIDEFVDASGKKHDWRKELVDKLEKLQASNGSFTNTAPRWMEGDPNLSTGYALLALKYCEPKAAK